MNSPIKQRLQLINQKRYLNKQKDEGKQQCNPSIKQIALPIKQRSDPNSRRQDYTEDRVNVERDHNLQVTIAAPRNGCQSQQECLLPRELSMFRRSTKLGQQDDLLVFQ
jgi:hypothetical protein